METISREEKVAGRGMERTRSKHITSVKITSDSLKVEQRNSINSSLIASVGLMY